ncbi:MAG: hypothetical protein KBT34_04535 [Prevotella sp.]|nr:hypothetical protein [Candidatus Prevotella equi]
MLNLRTIITTIAVALTMTVSAQDANTCEKTECAKNFKPYYYVSAQAGGASGFGGGNVLCDAVSPQYGVSVGAMFTRVVGARLNVTGYSMNNYLKSVDDYYKFNYINPNIDIMVNLYQLMSKKPNCNFGFYFIAGVGLNYAWNNKQLNKLQEFYGDYITEDVGNAWGTLGSKRKSVFTHSVRVGLALDFKVSRKFNVGIEGTLNNYGDRFNAINSSSSDWVVAGAGYVAYRFGGCKKGDCKKK